MFKFKRAIALLSAVAILSSFVVTSTALAGTFPDVTPDKYYYDAVETGVTDGWIDASNENFDPTRPINRAEASKMICEAKGLPYTAPATPSFPDVQPGEWYYDSVECLAQNGVVGGYADGNFGPADPIQRQQFGKMVVNAWMLPESVCAEPTFPDVPESLWSYNFVETAYHYSVINGYQDGRFGPLDTIIRADAAVMIVRAGNPVERPCDGGCPDGYSLVDDECVMTPEGGELVVSLSPDTPPTQVSIPSGATGVEVAAFDFTAGDNDVLINNLTLKRVGVGDPDDFSKVYLYHDGSKLTNGKTINDSTNEALFNNLGVMVESGMTETIWVSVDVERPLPGAAGIHAFQVTDADAVAATADTVSGAFPVVGNDFGTSEIEAGAIDVESAGSDYTRKVGELDQEVGAFTVFVDNTEDGLFKSITIYNDNDDVLENLTLWRGSEMVATAVKNGRYFTFVLDEPILIQKGDSVSFKIHADIGGSDGDMAELEVRYRTDIDVEGQTYGYSLFVDAGEGDDLVNSYCDEADPDGVDSNDTTVEAGQITVSFNGPVANDVPKNSNDVVLMDFSMTAQSNVDIEDMTINIEDNGSATLEADLDDIEVVCNGLLVASEGQVNIIGQTGANTFNDTWSIAAGETQDCQVRVDVSNTADGDGTEELFAVLDDLTAAGWTFRDSDTNDVITDIVPSGDIAGNVMTITEASLDVALASSPGAENLYVQGQDDVDIVAWVLTAGDAEDITINSITLEAYLDDDVSANPDFVVGEDDYNQDSGAENVLSSLTIYEGETMTPLDNPDSLDVNAANITVQYDTLNWVIPAGESRTLLVQSNISTTAPNDSVAGDPVDNDYVAVALNDIDAEYGSGTNVPATIPAGEDNSTPTIYQEIAESGELNLVVSPDTPNEALVSLGSSDPILVTQVEFNAVREAFTVEDLEIWEELGNDNNIDKVYIRYKDESGADVEKSKPIASDTVTFTGLNPPIYVPEQDDGECIVDVLVTTQDETPGVNGDNIRLVVTDGDDDAGPGDNETFRAIGDGSGEVLTEASNALAGANEVDGNTHTVYETYPVITVNDDLSPEGTLLPGANTLLIVLDVTAEGPSKDLIFDDAGDITIHADSVCTQVDADNVYLKDDDGTEVGDNAAGNICPSGDVTVAFNASPDEFIIGAGNTESLYIYGATVGEYGTEGDSIQVSLEETAGNIGWEIEDDAGGPYEEGDIIFDGDLFGGILVKP